MKNIIVKTLLTASFVASFTSCSLNDDWLSLNDPNRETANTFWKTTQQFDQGLSAAYSTWRRPGYFSRWFFGVMRVGVKALIQNSKLTLILLSLLITMMETQVLVYLGKRSITASTTLIKL